jgi:multidrug efflux pump subunit AcrA (membrane-fusion protein)
MDDQQNLDPEKPRRETVSLAPERSSSYSYLSEQILDGMPSLVSRGLIYLSLLVCIAGLTFASFTKLDVTVQCPAVVQPGQVKRAYAGQPAFVSQVMVIPGESVQKGQALLILRKSAEATAAELVVSAEIDGSVMDLPFRYRGQVVKEGDLLCTLQPGLAGLKVDMKVFNKDAGQIVPGMPVWLKLDSFPVAEFGAVKVQVSGIDPMPHEDSQSGYVYTASADLQQSYLEAHGRKYPIRPGMTATAEIVVSQRSMLLALVRGFTE